MTTTTTEEKDGNELIDDIAQTPNMDRFFDRNPKTLSDADYLELIEINRADRARQIAKKGK